MNNEERRQYLRDKFKRDQEHINYLFAKGYTSFQIADQLIHYMIQGLRQSIINEEPNLTEDQINLKMRENIIEYDRIKRPKRREL